MNKRKIINDPVFGFIKIKYDIIFDLIEHPVFQRLRRIRQMGMANFVYPGANHSRFQHAIGAMHLMDSAIETIKGKGHEISNEEAEAACIAILLHDIGHGPFSHTLEESLIPGVHHEEISLMIMEMLNMEFKGKLDLAISIFKGEYHKAFLHQLVSGQLDVDRLDYLRRDSFFTGVTEGVIGSDRIIKMLEVHNDHLVVEEKGIYSIEKFLVARRLMYWQVYLHKGSLAADQLLINMLQRAKELSKAGQVLFATPALNYFLQAQKPENITDNRAEFLQNFAELDDNDIISAAKVWSKHKDPILGNLCYGFINRKLSKIEISNTPFPEARIAALKKEVRTQLNISEQDVQYLVCTGSVSNNAYSNLNDNIKILRKDGSVKDIGELSDILNVSVLSGKVEKYFLCYPKEFTQPD